MDKPLFWNSLQVAAAYVAGTVGRPISVMQLLDAAIRPAAVANGDELSVIRAPAPVDCAVAKIISPAHSEYSSLKDDADCLAMTTKVSLPAALRGWVCVDMTRYSDDFPLDVAGVHSLAKCGEVGLDVLPDEMTALGPDTDNEMFFIPPWGKKITVQIDACGIRGDDLAQLVAQMAKGASPASTARAAASADADLTEKERQSMYKMIVAMAIDCYKYDPKAKRQEAVSDIVKAAQTSGLSLSENTVRKHLKAAADAVLDQGRSES